MARYLILVFVCAASLLAAEQRGQVTFNGVPVPGATVTAIQGDKKLIAVTDLQGVYSFRRSPGRGYGQFRSR